MGKNVADRAKLIQQGADQMLLKTSTRNNSLTDDGTYSAGFIGQEGMFRGDRIRRIQSPASSSSA